MPEEQSDVKLQKTTYPLKYKIEVTFMGREEMMSDDISSFNVIRAPYVKTGSFAILNLTLDFRHYLALYDNISRNQYPECKVYCYIVKNYNDYGNAKPPKVEDVFVKNYKVLNIQPLESFNYNSPFILCNIILSHPVLLYMQTTNGYNEILEDKTTLEALQAYEKWLPGVFGSGAFQFEHVGEQYALNKFKYEQILTRNATDLMIPTVLINNYKMWDTFGYYFFDDFRLDSGAKADITGWLVNLGDKNQFKPIDIYSYGDFTMGLKMITQTPLHDPFNALYQRTPSITTKNYEMQFSFRKSTQNREVPQITVDVQGGEHGSAVGTSIIRSSFATKSEKPTEETVIYAPDEHVAGMNRFDRMSQQLRDDMTAIETYFIRDSAIDYLQFNRRYNLNQANPNDYSFIPSCICNLFIRDTGKVPILVHHARFQVFRYRDDESTPTKYDATSPKG